MRGAPPRGVFVPSRPGPVTSPSAAPSRPTSTARTTTATAASATTSRRWSSSPPTARPHGRAGPRPELFWATAGGMGLTGVVARAPPCACSRSRRRTMRVDTERIRRPRRPDGPDGAARRPLPYSVAWIDTLARGRRWAGRCSPAATTPSPTSSPARPRRHPLASSPGRPARVLRGLPPASSERPTVRAFNEVWFRKAPSATG